MNILRRKGGGGMHHNHNIEKKNSIFLEVSELGYTALTVSTKAE
jgi:hypothetical protein